jgi:hypothetical protein
MKPLQRAKRAHASSNVATPSGPVSLTSKLIVATIRAAALSALSGSAYLRHLLKSRPKAGLS